MRLRLLGLAVATSFAAISPLQVRAQELTLVKDASSIEFVGTKPDGKHQGGFKKFEVAAIADFENASRSSLSINIDATSLWADDPKLTDHLKSPDFFDVRKHPAITFESTEIVPGEGEEPHAAIKGTMQMLGKSVEIEVPAKANVTDEMIELTATFEIDRTKWGMSYGQGKVDNTVKVTAKFTMKR
jgi:polyisoprenoid-binding protein YceI